MSAATVATVVLVCVIVVVAALGWALPARRASGRLTAGVLVGGLATLGLIALLGSIVERMPD